MNAVPKRKVINLAGGGMTASETLRMDMEATSKADVHAMILQIVGQETTAQSKLGNPPSITEVDGSKSKPVSSVNKKVVVLFGVQLAAEALRQVESALMTAIASSTNEITGALRNPANWEWRHIRNGKNVPISRSAPISFGPRDFLVLRPSSRIPYASAANKRVASGSRSLNYNPGKSKRVAKRNQNLGFMAMAARMARQIPDMVPFSVTAGMTTAFQVQGEVRKIGGTAYLLIAPRRRRAFRS